MATETTALDILRRLVNVLGEKDKIRITQQPSSFGNSEAEIQAVFEKAGGIMEEAKGLVKRANKSTSRAAEPVAWRWKPKHAKSWIYDPEASWLAKQNIDTIDVEPLYTSLPARAAP